MLQASDLVLALSHSGASEELTALLPSLTRIGSTLIAITGNIPCHQYFYSHD